MGTPDLDITEELWKQTKGTVRIGGFDLMWDFTEGLTKEQWINKQKVEHQDINSVFVLKSGRIIMPQLGII